MTIIIETGFIVSGANSYVSTDELILFSSLRGMDLSNEPVESLETLLIRASDFLMSYEDKLKGVRISPDQNLSFPRKGVKIYGFPLLEDTIPEAIRNAQMVAAIEIFNTNDIHNNPSLDDFIIKEKVDVLETHYADNAYQVIAASKLSELNVVMKPLLNLGCGVNFMVEKY